MQTDEWVRRDRPDCLAGGERISRDGAGVSSVRGGRERERS